MKLPPPHKRYWKRKTFVMPAKTVTIAGSGPSVLDYDGYANIVTNRGSTQRTPKRINSDYVYAPRRAFWHDFPNEDKDRKLICGKAGPCPRCPKHRCPAPVIYELDWRYWMKVYRKFNSKKKPSCGTQSVFAAIEFLGATKVELIGYDRVLGYDTTPWRMGGELLHDAEAELRCIKSLVEVVDLYKRIKEQD